MELNTKLHQQLRYCFSPTKSNSIWLIQPLRLAFSAMDMQKTLRLIFNPYLNTAFLSVRKI